MINSFEKEKFVVGKEYYTYYVDVNNKGNALKDYTGILKVKVISNEKSDYDGRRYTRFEILERSKKLSPTIESNIHFYMNGYGISSTNFFENVEDCILEHDKELKEIAKGQTTSNKERILDKLINKEDVPEKDKIEVESVAWFNSLSDSEKKMVRWLKHYYDGI